MNRRGFFKAAPAIAVAPFAIPKGAEEVDGARIYREGRRLGIMIPLEIEKDGSSTIDINSFSITVEPGRCLMTIDVVPPNSGEPVTQFSHGPLGMYAEDDGFISVSPNL